MKKIVATNNAPQAIGPYSQGVIINDLVFTSGQIPLTKDGVLIEGGIKEQTEQVMKNLEAVLSEAGSSFDKVIKTTCYLFDMGDFSAFNEVYGTYFTGDKPARSCVAVKTLPKNVLCEVEVIASL